ncbi:MAG: hypothetical protein QOH17_1900 [Pseudonocardiales bacterium]|jgi:hypothetical protein|nr:hypothetical protein [Pseudonocardiales bacterium]
MDHEPTGPDQGDRDDQDRVVSRRVQNPTDAEPGDDAVYQAADPLPDDDAAPSSGATSGGGVSTEDAADELAAENESEPVRSE